VHEGTDPAGERAAAVKAEALKFSKAVALYLDRQRGEVRGSTFENIETYLTHPRYFGPLHNKPVAKVTPVTIEIALYYLFSQSA
jgi:hypothetical protein